MSSSCHAAHRPDQPHDRPDRPVSRGPARRPVRRVCCGRLGLSETQPFRVCKAGEPCILQVDGTRIGVSRVVASNLYVIPDSRAV